MSGPRHRPLMLLVYAIMAVAALGIGTGIAHLVDPHDGGVRGVWTADENYCDTDGCTWLGTFTAPGTTAVEDVWILDDEPAHLSVGANFRAYFHDGGDDGQWVEIPHDISGWWLLGPGALVLFGTLFVWWRRDARSAAARERDDHDRDRVEPRPIPVAYEFLTVLVVLAAGAALIEAIELCWPGHGWHDARFWVYPIAIVGRFVPQAMRVRRYGPERVAATRVYDCDRRGRRRGRRTALLTFGWMVVALAVVFMSIGINVVLTNDLIDVWSCAAATAATVALTIGVAALTARVDRPRRAVDPTAASAVDRMTAKVLGLHHRS